MEKFGVIWNFENFPTILGLSLQTIVGLSIYLYTDDETNDKDWEVPVGYLLLYAGLAGAYLSGKTILLPIFWELSTFGALIVYSGLPFHEKRTKSLIALFTGSGISAILLATWVYLPNGNTFGIYSLLLGLLIKSAFSITHSWYPDLHEGSPSSTSATYSGVALNLPILLFMQHFDPMWLPGFSYKILVPIAGIGIFLGGVTAFFSRDVKRILAYSTIEKSNFIWLCAFLYKFWISNPSENMENFANMFLILFYLTILHHSISKTYQFLMYGFMGDLAQNNILDEIKGIGRLTGLPVVLIGLGTFSFAALPGTLGFLSESTYLYIISRLIDLPEGKALVILPSMIIFILGLVMGLGAHLKLYLSIALSIPEKKLKDHLEGYRITKNFFNTFMYLSYLLLMMPLLINVLFLYFDLPFVDAEFKDRFRIIFFINILFNLYFLFIVYGKFSHVITIRKGWDCGNKYNGAELSIPASVISDPLSNSIGITMSRKEQDSLIDLTIKKQILRFLDLGKYWIRQVESGDTSNYLAFSSTALLFTLLLIFFFRLLNGAIWNI